MTTKRKVSKYTYLDVDGKESRFPDEYTVAMRQDWFGLDGETIVETRTYDPNLLPEPIQVIFLWYAAKLVNQRAQAEHKDAAEAVEKVDARWDRFAEGEWVKERDSVGPSNTILVQAIVAHLTAQGLPPDDDKVKEIRENVKNSDYRDGAMKNIGVKAEYEAIKLANVKARAKDAAKAAKDADVVTAGL